jgi:hypothetical protein
MGGGEGEMVEGGKVKEACLRIVLAANMQLRAV